MAKKPSEKIVKQTAKKLKGKGKKKKLRNMFRLKEGTQHKRKIRKLEKQVNENLNKMGELFYRQKKGDKDKKIQAKINKIFKDTKKLKSEIEPLKSKIKEIQPDYNNKLIKQKKKKRSLFPFKRKKKIGNSIDSS